MTYHYRGTQLPAAWGYATVLADMDFETYGEAGYIWDGTPTVKHPLGRFRAPRGYDHAKKKEYGLTVVGAAVYAQHPKTEVLSFKYDLKDGRGVRFWRPGMPNPQELFDFIAAGGLVEAWNSGFEWWIWNFTCTRLYGWPPLPESSLRCAMAKARAHALPGGLEICGNVIDAPVRKDPDGSRLLKKFSVPQQPKPTKKNPNPPLRIRPEDDPEDAAKLYGYNERDIQAEACISERVPDLTPLQLDFWLADQRINHRGVQVDVAGIENCISIIEQAYVRYNAELSQLTGGAVIAGSENEKLQGWLAAHGVYMDNMQAETIKEKIKELRKNPRSTDVGDPFKSALRALEIRDMIGSASVRKLYALANQSTAADRIHDLFVYHATRTGRAAGQGPQPQNLPSAGPNVFQCWSLTAKAGSLTFKQFKDQGWSDVQLIEHGYAVGCKRHYRKDALACPWCGVASPAATVEWCAEAAEDALQVIAHASLDLVEYYFGNAVEIVASCLRALFISAPGHDLIASDYSAIEAVVLAELAGETWRQEVFRTHGLIYEKTLSDITGIPFDEILDFKKRTGQHHPQRKPLGKIPELASGYGGWVGAWVQFGADEFFNEAEIKEKIKIWRAKSPNIVEFWGGQFRGAPWDADRREELFGLEGAAIAAVMNPGQAYSPAYHPNSTGHGHKIAFQTLGDVLYCRLLSGRLLTYHRPRLYTSERGGWGLTYEGWNTNPKNGPKGWVRMSTYGGKLTENIVQATSFDILANAIVNLERAGYPVVLHVHDEIVVEVPEGWGSVEEVERIMMQLPDWAAGWAIKAAGGWRGKRYRK